MNQSKMATSLQRRQQGEQFSLMDAANLPDSPSYPKRPLFGVAGAFAGLLLGLIISAIFEYRNTAIRTEDDVYSFLQLNTLIAIEQVGDRPMEATPQAATAKDSKRGKRFGKAAPAIPEHS